MFSALLGLAAILLTIEAIRRLRCLRSSGNSTTMPLPPGPNSLPFFGNIFALNKDAPYLTYTEWSKTYGDIVRASVLGQNIVILNSEEVAVALLEKRSQKYSDRPIVTFADQFSWEWATTLTRYGPRFRLHRRLLHQVFSARAASSYRPRQLQRAYEMSLNLVANPTHYEEHFTTQVLSFAASIVMEVTYGYDIKQADKFVTSMQRASDIFLRVVTPETIALCAAFPFIQSLPAWFPGMGFMSEAAECRSLMSEASNAPYEWVQRRVGEGNAVPSMVSDAITRYSLNSDSKNSEIVQAIKESAGTQYAASVETMNATLMVFTYLMMNYPEVQRRAHAEIDGIVGRQKLPTFEDRRLLPYVDAMIRETLRWHPVAPIGIPHATSEDDVYQGYYIPQGSTVVANLWAISHNEEKYPNPDAFIPERFLLENGMLNEDNIPWAFGFGRRICPGRHIADASLWSAILCMLALFRIEKTEGSDNVKWSTGLTSHPLPFPCKFILRDEDMDGEKLSSWVDACS